MELKIEYLNIDDLKHYANNSKNIQMNKLNILQIQLKNLDSTTLLALLAKKI